MIDQELDELVDWQLARGESGLGFERPLPVRIWLAGDPPLGSLGAWLVDQVHEADQLVQRLRKRGRL